jgi:hypothetical protein
MSDQNTKNETPPKQAEIKKSMIITEKPNYWNHWKVNQFQFQKSATNATLNGKHEVKREALSWKKKRYFIFSKSFLFRN